ncbi:hypothetical protein CR513_36120, partial [Mucuna pruriens]
MESAYGLNLTSGDGVGIWIGLDYLETESACKDGIGLERNLLVAPDLQRKIWQNLRRFRNRCITRGAVNITPTLEEYERILRLPMAGFPPYFYQGYYSSWASIAKIVRMPESKMVQKRKNGNGLEGLPQSYLEERLNHFLEKEDWLAVMDIFGLLIYGIVLFPHLENYIDLATIDTFLARRDRGENPIMEILANTYYTLNYCCKKNGKSLRCCTHLLYLWLTAHLFHSK